MLKDQILFYEAEKKFLLVLTFKNRKLSCLVSSSYEKWTQKTKNWNKTFSAKQLHMQIAIVREKLSFWWVKKINQPKREQRIARVKFKFDL